MAYRHIRRSTVAINASTPALISSGGNNRVGVRILNSTGLTIQLRYQATGESAPTAAYFNGTSGYPDFENLGSGSVFEDSNREQDLYCLTTAGSANLIVQEVVH